MQLTLSNGIRACKGWLNRVEAICGAWSRGSIREEGTDPRIAARRVDGHCVVNGLQKQRVF